MSLDTFLLFCCTDFIRYNSFLSDKASNKSNVYTYLLIVLGDLTTTPLHIFSLGREEREKKVGNARNKNKKKYCDNDDTRKISTSRLLNMYEKIVFFYLRWLTEAGQLFIYQYVILVVFFENFYQNDDKLWKNKSIL